jgi:hypothetical protein
MYAIEEELVQHPYLEPVDLYKLCFQAWFGPAHMVTDKAVVTASIIEETMSMRAGYHPLIQDIGNKEGFWRFSLSCFADLDTDTLPKKAEILAEIMLLSAPMGRSDMTIAQLWPIIFPLVRELFPANHEAWEHVNALAAKELLPHHSERYIKEYNPHYRVIHPNLSNKLPELLI